MEEDKKFNIRKYLEIIKKRYPIILGVVFVGISSTAYYIFTAPKIYAVQTKIIIADQASQATTQAQNIRANQTAEKKYIQTQVSILDSRILATKVIEKMDLRRDPDFVEIPSLVDKLIGMVQSKALPNSNVIVFSVFGQDPIKITNIANTWIEEFIRLDAKRQGQIGQEAPGWLEEKISAALKKQKQAQKDLDQFVVENKASNLPEIKSQSEVSLNALREQVLGLEKSILESSKKYKQRHPKMLDLTSALRILKSRLEDEEIRFFQTQKLFSEYSTYKTNINTYENLYKELLDSAKEPRSPDPLLSSKIRVVDEAVPPQKPIKPNPKKDLAIAFVGSIFFGTVIVFFVESIDSTVKTSDDVESNIKFPFLGYIPFSQKDSKQDRDVYTITYDKPDSLTAEAFRNAKASLLFSSTKENPIKTIIVTSSIPGEGKSFVAANLAITFAQAGESTLLIDGDLRKGKVHKAFNIKNEQGLGGVLAGISDAQKVVVKSNISNLYLMTRGPYVPNPAQLLSSGHLKDSLQELKVRFKRIIIDSVPVLGLADALIVAKKTEGLVFVIKAGSTSIKLVKDSRKLLSNNLKVTGSILNNVKSQSGQAYYYQYHYIPQKSNG